MAGFVHCFDDLVGLEGDEFHGCVVVERKAVHALVAAETNDRSGHTWIGDGGAVAEEIAVEEEVAAKVRDCGGFLLRLHVFEVLVQVVIDVHVVALGYAEDLLKGGMGF